ncbi:MAG: RNA polymerase sigma-70 factor [Filimonas sp.]|nr:RNA polymerase sigma-70 factor [Filimonas sp.]
MKELQVHEIRDGNLQAYYRAFHAYHEKLYQYIYKYTQSSYYAEETVQLAFIKLWEKRENLSDEHTLSAQLFRIAKSIVIDLLRKEQLRKTQELSDVYISENKNAEKIIYKEELQTVLTAINELPAQCKQVFTLSRINHLTHKEISDQLAISPKTIEAHISKAIRTLRKALNIFF